LVSIPFLIKLGRGLTWITPSVALNVPQFRYTFRRPEVIVFEKAKDRLNFAFSLKPKGKY
jgi:hypothetical protein